MFILSLCCNPNNLVPVRIYQGSTTVQMINGTYRDGAQTLFGTPTNGSVREQLWTFRPGTSDYSSCARSSGLLEFFQLDTTPTHFPNFLDPS